MAKKVVKGWDIGISIGEAPDDILLGKSKEVSFTYDSEEDDVTTAASAGNKEVDYGLFSWGAEIPVLWIPDEDAIAMLTAARDNRELVYVTWVDKAGIGRASWAMVKAVKVTRSIKGNAEGSITLVGSGAVIVLPAKCLEPKFSLKPGFYSGTQSLELSCATLGADIYYTIDGSTPTSGSTHYVAAISIAASKAIKAIAIKAGIANSAVVTGAYIIGA